MSNPDLITSTKLAQTNTLRTAHKQSPPKASSELGVKSPRDALTLKVRTTKGPTRDNQQQQPTTVEGNTNPSSCDARAHTRSSRDVILQQQPIQPTYHPSPSKEEAEEGDDDGDENSPLEESEVDSNHSSPHSTNRNFYRDQPTQPTLESLQQLHESELQRVSSTRSGRAPFLWWSSEWTEFCSVAAHRW